MRNGDFCKDQREKVFIPGATKLSRHEEEFISLDLRSQPVGSRLDRVCCRCGESLASDGYCEQCKQGRKRETK